MDNYGANSKKTAPGRYIRDHSGKREEPQVHTLSTDILKEFWIYVLYILLGCAISSALNVLHVKYFLEIPLKASSFVIPAFAGGFFGYLVAYIRPPKQQLALTSNVVIYINYILLACIVTFALFIIHTEWFLGVELKRNHFIAPTLTGIFFGYLLARIRMLNNKLFELATTDILTRAYNRMHFERVLNSEIDRAIRHGGHFCIIYFDVDHFKEINDKHGHPVGDSVLSTIAKVVHDSNRSPDIFARVGGDEFVILSTSTRIEGAYNHAKRLQTNINNLNIENVGAVSCSFGIAEFIKEKDDVYSIVKAADAALYRAKKKGRDCIEMNKRETKTAENQTGKQLDTTE